MDGPKDNQIKQCIGFPEGTCNELFNDEEIQEWLKEQEEILCPKCKLVKSELKIDVRIRKKKKLQNRHDEHKYIMLKILMSDLIVK